MIYPPLEIPNLHEDVFPEITDQVKVQNPKPIKGMLATEWITITVSSLFRQTAIQGGFVKISHDSVDLSALEGIRQVYRRTFLQLEKRIKDGL